MIYNRIMVAVDGNTADEEAISLACSFARESRGTVFVLYVIEVPWSFPLDAEMGLQVRKAEAVVDYMESLAKSLHTSVQTEVVQSRNAGLGVVKAAIDHRIDLIVMNTLYERKYGEFTLGSAAPYVLENAQCHVWLYRGPMNGAS